MKKLQPGKSRKILFRLIEQETFRRRTLNIRKTGIEIDWIYIAKAIGIILVVIGHFSPSAAPAYWSNIRGVIYKFHMPLFFLLSGYLYDHGKYSYLTLIKRKSERLLIPFISIAIIFFVIKLFFGKVFKLQNPFEVSQALAVAVDPLNSHMPLLWFLHALMIIFLIYPLFRTIIDNNWAILILFLIFNLLGLNRILFFGKPIFYAIFFILGNIMKEKWILVHKYTAGKWHHFIIVLSIFISAYWFYRAFNDAGRLNYIFLTIFGVFGSLSIINIALMLEKKDNNNPIRAALKKVGFYSMTIYLFHTIFVSGVRITAYQILNHLSVNFEMVACTAVIAGILCPLILEKKLLRSNRYSRKYILGIK